MEMSAESRFRDDANLVRQVLQHLDRPQLAEVAPALLPHVASILYTRMDYVRYKWFASSRNVRVQDHAWVTDDQRWTRQYLEAVRMLDASYTPKVLARDSSIRLTELFSPETIANVRLRCPGLHTIIRHPVDGDFASHWKVELDEDGGGQVWVSYTHILDVEKDASAIRASFAPPVSWPGYEMHVTYFAVVRSGMEWDRDTRHVNGDGTFQLPTLTRPWDPPMPVEEWLEDVDNIDRQIDRLSVEFCRLKATTLTKILASRHQPGRAVIVGLHIGYIENTTFEQVKNIGEAAIGLERLRIDGMDNRRGYILESQTLAEFVNILRTSFTDVKELDLTLELPWRWEENLLFEESNMPTAQLDYTGKLEKITIRFPRPGVILASNHFPAFTFARNLACLGSPGCEYYLKCSDPSDEWSPKALQEMTEYIHRLQELPSHRARGIQAADVFDIDLSQPSDMDNLGWKVTGEPIYQGDMTQLRCQREALRDRLVSLQRNLDQLNLLFAPSIQDSLCCSEVETSALRRTSTDLRGQAWLLMDEMLTFQQNLVEGEVDWEEEEELALYIENTFGPRLSREEQREWQNSQPDGGQYAYSGH